MRNANIPGRLPKRICGAAACLVLVFIMSASGAFAHEQGPEEEDWGDFSLDLDYIESYTEDCWDIIFFGDSRVVGMAQNTGGYHYVGKVSMGYSWMCGEGLELLKGKMEEYPEADVVFGFGVNDLDNIGAYIGFYRQMIDAYPDRRLWLLSVNPVNEQIERAHGYTVTNASICAFNEQLKAALPERYLDCYSYLMEYGFNTADGVHYDSTTCFAIQDFTWRSITRILDEEKAAAETETEETETQETETEEPETEDLETPEAATEENQ